MLWFLLPALCSFSTTKLEQVLLDEITPILDQQAAKYNISFSFGFKHALADVGIGSGYADYHNRLKADAHSLYPAGSVTKTFTAVAIMQLVQSGRLSLDDPAHIYIDPFLKRTNGTTLRKLWGGIDAIESVTIENLVSMRSGINDYNDAFFRNVTLTRPDYDYGPIDILYDLNKTLAFKAGTQGQYSSTNFELLGLVLCQLANSTSWKTYDIKKALIAPGSPLSRDCRDMVFMGEGKCNSVERVVHQFNGKFSINSAQNVSLQYQDLYDDSCLNGWLCGNIATSPQALSRFYFDLFGGNSSILEAESVARMQHWKPLTIGFSPGLEYGFGLMLLDYSDYSSGPHAKHLNMVGHVGEDYGSQVGWSGYNPALKFASAIAMNGVIGMNCSEQSDAKQVGADVWAAYTETACFVMGNATAILGRVTATTVPAFGRCNPKDNNKANQKQKQGAGPAPKVKIECIWK